MSQQELPKDLIDYIETNGEHVILNENNSPVQNTKEIQEKLEKQLDIMNNTLAYDTYNPIPGTATYTPSVDTDKLKDSTKALMAEAAFSKLRRENKKPIDEQVKEYYINAVINQQKTAYLEKYGYIMSGNVLRKTKRMVLKKYESGKLRPSQKEYDDIVDYLNSPLNDADNKKVNPMNTANTGVSQQMSSLISSI